LVIYPIFDLAKRDKDLHKWLRDLEETMLLTLESFAISGRRFPPHTGAWVGDLKIAAIGIKVKRWVSMHGIALNCNLDLGAFETIVPCGIRDYGVTSLSQELGKSVSLDEAKPAVWQAFQRVFNPTESF
jgi:lipoyl(octanoyl) transferase